MNQHFFNIYRNHSYDFLGTVAVEADYETDIKPTQRAAEYAGEKLGLNPGDVHCISSTQQQFWKTGI